MSAMTDIFGRTEQQIVADIERGERIYKIASAWSGNEGLAIALRAKRGNIDVDRRLLAELRGERRSDVQLLEGQQLRKWRVDLCRRGTAGIR